MKTSVNRISASALAFVVCVGAAAAQTRPSTTNMTCGAASALVASRGEVVLSTGRDLFDRYVRGQGFCGPGDLARPAFVKTLDNPQCFVGHRCVPASLDMR